MRILLKPLSRFMAKFDDKTKDIGFVCGYLGLVLLYFLHDWNLLETRYLYSFIVGCFFLGVMILCGIRGDFSTVPIEINKPFFAVWMLYGGVQLISGIINTVDWLPEAMLILVAYPIFFWVLNSWNINKAFSILAKACAASLVFYIMICFLLFPVVSAQYAGPFSNPNSVAQYLVVVLCCLMVEVFEGSHSRKGHLFFNIILAGVACALLIYSNSRAGMLSAIVAFLAYIVLQCIKRTKKKELFKRIAVIVLVSIVSYFAVSWVFSLRQYLPIPAYDNIEHKFYYLSDDLEWDNALEQISQRNSQKMNVTGKDLDAVSAGRTTIWVKYAEKLNWRGHKSQGPIYVKEFEKMSGRSANVNTTHNFLLQQAYNHGIFAGIISLVLNIYGGVLAVIYALKKDGPYSAMPLLIILAFGVVSLLESPTTSFYHLILLHYFFMHAPLLMERK